MKLSKEHIPYLILLIPTLFLSIEMILSSWGGYESIGEVLGTLLFFLWVLSPYIVTGAIFKHLSKKHPVYISFIIVASFLLIFTLESYFMLFTDGSSTAGLIFIPLPFVLIVFGSVFSYIGFLIERKITTRN